MKNETDCAVHNAHSTGGLYAKINMSLKSANIMVASLTALLVAAMVFVIVTADLPLNLTLTAVLILSR